MDNAVLAVDGGRNMVCLLDSSSSDRRTCIHKNGMKSKSRADEQVAGINDGVPLPNEAY